MSTKRKVYTFYIIAILVMVSALMLFNLNIIAKAIIGLLIVFCIFVMRSIQTAYHLPDDIDPDTMQPIDTSVNTSAAVPTAKLDHNSNVDLYLRLLIEVDEDKHQHDQVGIEISCALKHGHLPHKPLHESIFLSVKTEERCQQEEGKSEPNEG